MGVWPSKVDPPAPGCLGEYLKSTDDKLWPPPSTHRGTLSLPDGCSSHNTAVAVAALGGFLYALTQYPPAHGELRHATLAPPTATHVNGSMPAIHQEDKTHAFGPWVTP